MLPNALILEDDSDLADVLSRVLVSLGYQVKIAGLVADARRAIRENPPAILLVDIDLPDGNGLDLMYELRNDTRGRFIILSGDTSQPVVVKSINADASDVLSKPVNLKELRASIENVSLNVGLIIDAHEAANADQHGLQEHSWVDVGSSSAIRHLRTMISYVAALPRGHAVLTGDVGVDHASVAGAIHKRSSRLGKFVQVNCAEEHPDTFADRLFGMEDPDTGNCVQKGYVEEAVSGTLVLQDIEAIPRNIQARLLGFLHSGRFVRTNGSKTLHAGVTIIGATHMEVDEMLDADLVRHDFFYRLARYIVKVPTLQECSSDKVRFAEYLLDEINQVLGTSKVLSDDALGAIASQRWPGNILELHRVLMEACTDSACGRHIDKHYIDSVSNDDVVDLQIRNLVGQTFWDVEKAMLLATLESTSGDKKKSADLLGISLKTLYNRINSYR